MRSLADMVGPPPGAPPPPEATRCQACGAPVAPVWVCWSPKGGWYLPLQCPACCAADHEKRRAAREAREQRKRDAERIERAGLHRARREKTLDSFELRPGTEDALARARGFVQQIREQAWPPQGLFFVGPNGSGKTHLALGMLNGVLDAKADATALFVDFADYLSALGDAWHSSEGERARDIRATVEAVDLLVLDDLGAARSTRGEWDREEMVRVLNRRIEARKPLITTADLSPDGLADKLGPRVVDRLYEACRIVALECGSYRKERMG